MTNQKPISENPLTGACSDLITAHRFDGHRSSDSDDVRQEAIVRALTAGNASSVRTPLGYLMRIVRNTFIDRQRRRAREAAVHKSLELTETSRQELLNPERIVSARQELERVAVAISLLPPRCRQAFVLHRFEQLSYAKIARRMGIGVGTVEKHIAEAMSRIGRAVHNGDEDRR